MYKLQPISLTRLRSVCGVAVLGFLFSSRVCRSLGSLFSFARPPSLTCLHLVLEGWRSSHCHFPLPLQASFTCYDAFVDHGLPGNPAPFNSSFASHPTPIYTSPRLSPESLCTLLFPLGFHLLPPRFVDVNPPPHVLRTARPLRIPRRLKSLSLKDLLPF